MIFLKKIKSLIFKLVKAIYLVPIYYEVFLENHYEIRRKRSRNPFLQSFKRYSIFSQSDEDSIIDEIIKRLKIEKGNFIELGVGNGSQNNSLNLLAQGWKGIWIGNEELIFKPGKNLKFINSWITKDNIIQTISSNLSFFNKEINFQNSDIDILSIDLDGNDYYIWDAILSGGFCPKIIIAEYNGSLGPRAIWRMPYKPNNNWKLRKDNYFGASFLSYVKLFFKYNYIPVCCNSDTGVNLFLVKKKYQINFKEIENLKLNDIFENPHYALSIFSKTHKLSISTLKDISEI
tara:strand:- start:1423 stop:2292 length:870 start_codon:yes stop_codon:yes gene_type:complete